MAQIVRSPESKADAVEIWAYIARDNPAAADRLMARFDQTFRNLATHPQVGKSVEELAPNLRFFPIGSYLVFYRPLHQTA